MSQNDVWKKKRMGMAGSLGNQTKSWLNGQNIQPLQSAKVTDRPRRIGLKQAGLKGYRET